MSWDAIGAIGELLGGVVVIGTLFFLAFQVRQNTEQTRLSSIRAINASNDSAFEPIYIPENTAVFTKAQSFFPDVSEHERVLFDMLMARLIGSIDATTYQFEHGAYDDELYWGAVRFYSTFVSTPGGRAWFEGRKALFSKACVHNLERAANDHGVA